MAIETELLTLGNDQLSHMHEIIFPSGIPGGDQAEEISLRADSSFEPPEESVSTYEFSRFGKKVVKTSTFEETAKELTFEVRLDQQWKVYDDLKNWYDNVRRAKTTIQMADLRTKLMLRALDSDKAIVKTLIYTDTVLKGLNVSSFDVNTGEPIKLTLNFIYGDIEEE